MAAGALPRLLGSGSGKNFSSGINNKCNFGAKELSEKICDNCKEQIRSPLPQILEEDQENIRKKFYSSNADQYKKLKPWKRFAINVLSQDTWAGIGMFLRTTSRHSQDCKFGS